MAAQASTNQMDTSRHDRPWGVVLGSATALMVCNGPIILFTFGVLVGPISAEFGWPRSSLASAVVAAHAAGALMMPFIGGLLDRFGTRKLAIPAIIAFALAFGSVAILPGSPLQFVAAYAILGLVGAGHSTLPYSRVVSTWFHRQRGLALGVALAGVGIGTALVPQLARLLIASHGWRGAYVGLALVVAAIALPAVAILVRDPPHDRIDAGVDRTRAAVGTTLAEAVVGWRFWALGSVLFLVAAAVNGTIAHIVPMLVDRGVTTMMATAALSASGLALIGGRVVSGFCLDRFFGPFVAAAFFAVPLVGLLLLGLGADGGMAIMAAVLLGTGIGAEVDIMAFLIGRYFGLAHYGKIYGTLLAFFTLGSGMGPWLVALPFDKVGSYTPALAGAAIALFFASMLVSRLGAYRFD